MRWTLILLAASLFSGRVHAASLSQGAWKLRDVTANSSEFASKHPTLKLESHFDNDRATCTIIDTTGGEHAITLAFCIPLDAIGGTWCDDPQTERKIVAAATQPYSNCTDRAGGLNDEASMYPFAVVIDARDAIATVIACPADVPRMARFVYDAAAKELRAEFDLGLSPIPEQFKSRADATVMMFEVPAKWAFRRAIEKYWQLFPEAFVRRNKTAGIWRPFGEIGGIKDAADFGFAFHEIIDVQANPRVLGDDERVGCGSYLYVEPQTYWQWFKGKGKETAEARVQQLEADAKAGDAVSRATMISGVIHADGKRDLYMEDVPYTPQRPFGNDPNPLLVDADRARNWPSKARYEIDRLGNVLGWNGKPNPGVEGVYIDSMEGWGELRDYDKNHWKYTQFPLTFDVANHNKVALLNFWGTYAFVREMSQRMHRQGLLLFGNDAYYRRWQLAPWVDVPGREYTWVDNKGYLTPVEDSHYLFIRTMSGKRPYVMLMNNKFEDGSVMEPYFLRSLFYGVYPSMFAANQAANETEYFDNPAWYNRDRALFKKYIPLIRKVDAAGWEPVPYASVLPQSVRIERWGSFDRGNLIFTLWNTTPADEEATIALDRRGLKIDREVKIVEQVTAKALQSAAIADEIRVRVHLPAQGYGMISVERAK